jgi:4-alpha-glucanotransferase
MIPRRSAGTLMHITSLPGSYGCGDLGPASVRFVDWLADTGQSWWQMLPLDPPGPGFSPYSSRSAFAINPLLLSPEVLRQQGLLTATELKEKRWTTSNEGINWQEVEAQKNELLDRAVMRWQSEHGADEESQLNAFVEANSYWLPHYVTFCRNQEKYRIGWIRWDSVNSIDGWRDQPRALNYLLPQYWAHQQWQALRSYAERKGVGLIGDLPLYVSHQSADVWQHRELFKLHSDGSPARIAGVPPDYFNEDGQLWGMPVYDWQAMAENDYEWWRQRLKVQLRRFDQVRLDHFRGIAAFWEVPATAESARKGWWRKGPGEGLLNELQVVDPKLSIIAEDLGLITDDVIALRKKYGMPGMAVLQFAFSGQPDNPHLPNNLEEQQVVYTGTHDNNTAEGWYHEAKHHERRVMNEIALRMELPLSDPVHQKLIKMAFASEARLAIVPTQDWLGLGSEARMNIPGTPEGNWKWRLSQAQWENLLELPITDLIKQHRRRGH